MEKEQVEKFKKMESKELSEDIIYSEIKGIEFRSKTKT